jgi:hypothetical protein
MSLANQKFNKFLPLPVLDKTPKVKANIIRLHTEPVQIINRKPLIIQKVTKPPVPLHPVQKV